MPGQPGRGDDHHCASDWPRSSQETPPTWDRVIVLANRAPFRHERALDGGVSVTRSASGLVTALEPLVERYSGIWVAHGAGSADAAVVDARGGLRVPAASPQYRLRYVWLPEHEHQGHYNGFSNEGLWPLCHAVHVQPVFRSNDFQMYRNANSRFAAAVCEEALGGSPIVLVQDYHFALAPRLLRARLPLSTIVTFWHIPWPHPGALRTCPWARELLDGLLGSDVVGVQTPDDAVHFLKSVKSLVRADIDWRRRVVRYRGHETRVRAYPVGVEWTNQCVRTTPPSRACREEVRRDLHLPSDVRLGIGVDRLDYTKGILEKFLAIERLLEVCPDLRGHFTFIQVAEPSRECLPAYRALRQQLTETSQRVNGRFGTTTCRPINLLDAHHEPATVYRFYRAADLCYVGSLRDGMNLVAKEYVSARDDERGVLVLSKFAGAARQLRAALMVNPYSVDESADILARALEMTDAEQSRRMRLLRAVVKESDTYCWARQLLQDARPPRRREASQRIPA
jgi:trehalose 6-phosphate synthase